MRLAFSYNITNYANEDMQGIILHSNEKIVKVRQFQNEFMKSSFLPKYERKIVKISALRFYFGRNDDFINSF